MNLVRRSPLLFALTLALAPSLALAAESPLMKWVRSRVEAEVLIPAKKQASLFSRGMPAPREQRVRLLSPRSVSGGQRGRFVPFAVDMRVAKDWTENLTGCVYKGSGKVYIKRGEQYRPAAFLRGKNVKAEPGVCQTVPKQS